MIVITTPTGRIGRRVLERVLEAEVPVRVVVRDPARLDDEVRGRVEVVPGAHDDVEVLSKAFAGADTLFWVVPPNPRAESAAGHYRSFTEAACRAITDQQVGRVVAVSSLGRDYPEDAGLLTPAYLMDELLERTGVDYRALRMPFFMENLLNQVESIHGQGVFAQANAAERPLATVATRDVAEVAAGLLLDRGWSGQDDVPVIGPDALSPTEMATVIAQVLARPVRFHQVRPDDYKATMLGFGMTDAWAQGLVDMAVAQNNGVYDAELRTAPSVARTSFQQWCEEELRPAVQASRA